MIIACWTNCSEADKTLYCKFSKIIYLINVNIQVLLTATWCSLRITCYLQIRWSAAETKNSYNVYIYYFQYQYTINSEGQWSNVLQGAMKRYLSYHPSNSAYNNYTKEATDDWQDRWHAAVCSQCPQQLWPSHWHSHAVSVMTKPTRQS